MTPDEAKEQLRITELWAHLHLPGDCRKNPCHSPFYERASKPSFSVFNDGRAFHDLRTGEGGSAIDFLILATGLSREAACRKFIELAGGGRYEPQPLPKRPAMAPQARQRPVFPAMDGGTEDEWRKLAELRKLNLQAVWLARAEAVGLLRFATLHGQRAFIVTDNEGLNAQARRLDGEPWEHIEAKAYTLPKSWASWPLGIKTGQGGYAKIALVEGGPDLLAALHFIHHFTREADVFPVAILGASQRIHEDALPFFTGKRVRIYPHGDEAGRNGAARWARQLEAVGAEVDCFNFEGLRKADGSPIADLNDCTSISLEDAKELEGLLP